MNVYMQQCIINLLQNPPPLAQSEFLEEEPPEIADKLQPLFTFINNQLDLFSESLYHSVFIKVLRRVWFALIKVYIFESFMILWIVYNSGLFLGFRIIFIP